MTVPYINSCFILVQYERYERRPSPDEEERGKNRALAPPNGQITLRRPTTVGATHGTSFNRSGGPGYPSGRSPPDTVGDLPPQGPRVPALRVQCLRACRALTVGRLHPPLSVAPVPLSSRFRTHLAGNREGCDIPTH